MNLRFINVLRTFVSIVRVIFKIWQHAAISIRASNAVVAVMVSGICTILPKIATPIYVTAIQSKTTNTMQRAATVADEQIDPFVEVASKSTAFDARCGE